MTDCGAVLRATNNNRAERSVEPVIG
jgi:hypothetical protein